MIVSASIFQGFIISPDLEPCLPLILVTTEESPSSVFRNKDTAAVLLLAKHCLSWRCDLKQNWALLLLDFFTLQVFVVLLETNWS